MRNILGYRGWQDDNGRCGSPIQAPTSPLKLSLSTPGYIVPIEHEITSLMNKHLQGRVERFCLHQRKDFRGMIAGIRLQQLVATRVCLHYLRTRLFGLIRSGLRLGEGLEKGGCRILWHMLQLEDQYKLSVQSTCMKLRLLQDRSTLSHQHHAITWHR